MIQGRKQVGNARTVLKLRARRELCASGGFRGSGMPTDLEVAGAVREGGSEREPLPSSPPLVLRGSFLISHLRKQRD